MRTIIEVPDDVIQTLDRVRKSQRKSRAAIIRDAIQVYLEGTKVKDDDAAFGIWKEKGVDGLRYQEKLRSEWD
jgi:metal-responsive CopG/Arc/MetJ family transcriptional regulator